MVTRRRLHRMHNVRGETHVVARSSRCPDRSGGRSEASSRRSWRGQAMATRALRAGSPDVIGLGRCVRWALGVLVAACVALGAPGVSYAASSITAGGSHTCAVKADGTPVCWGANGDGQATVPAGTGSVTQITAGYLHSCAIKTGGTPVCWGSNSFAQSAIPAGTGSVTQVTVGYLHSCAIKTGGTPVCWGHNGNGETTIPAGTGSVTQITAGQFHTCAIKTGGTPVCWGYNAQGQATIPAGTGSVTQITAGYLYSCAIKTDGTPVCWGSNSFAQSVIPAGIGSVTQIMAGTSHTCAIKSDGTPVCWGNNAQGKATIPAGVGSVTQITAADVHTCAIKTGGTPVCWGSNGQGRSTIPAGLLDETPPLTSDDVPVASVSANVRVTLTASDAGSGVAATYYATGVSPADPTTASSPYDAASQPLLGDGERIKYFSVDVAGNTETMKTSGVAHVTPVNTARPQISGTLKVGSVLSATTGEWDNSPTAYAYAWQRCTTTDTLASCEAIDAADQTDYTLTGADDEQYLRVIVTATNASGSAAQPSDPTAQITRPVPVNTASPVISGTLEVGSVLSATTGDWENSPTAYAYVWQRCTNADTLASCSSIDGADAPTYELVGADDEHYLRVTVTATNSGGDSAETSEATAQITRLALVNSARPVITGTGKVGSILSATTGGWENSPAAYAYAWKRCSTNNTLASCMTIDGADAATYELTGADDLSWVRVIVTATNSAGSLAQHSNPTVKITRPRPVSTALALISGTLKVGSTLSATSGEWSNVPASYAYVWKRCTSSALTTCVVIAGATQDSYTLTGDDDTLYLRVTVTATNSGGSATSSPSNRTAKITRVKPVNTARPVISGTPQVGQTLSATDGSWDNVPAGYAYTWKRCTTSDLSTCTSISAADQSTHTLTADDAGRYIRVTVTATNSGGATTSPYANRTAKITSPA